MNLNRRQFVVLGAAAAAGCDAAGEPQQSVSTPATAPPPATSPAPVAPTSRPGEPRRATTGPAGTFDAGPASDFQADGVYEAFRGDGFFLVRRGQQLSALSSVCTHKGCKVRAQDDRSYLCKCHGSRFDAEGKVQKPPAKRDLPRLKVALDENEHVLVQLPAGRNRT